MLQNIKNATNIKNFPVHAELRLDLTGKFGIIEVNPMRFAGFCVADLTWFAYGFNPYEYYFNGKEPDWDHILQGKEGKIYGFVLGDIPTGISNQDIQEIDYQKYRAKFSKVLELRKINFYEYPIFSITFAEFEAERPEEMKALMNDDFRDVIKLKGNLQG